MRRNWLNVFYSKSRRQEEHEDERRSIAQDPLDTFSRNFPVDGEVVNSQLNVNLLATSRSNGIWETTPRHKRHGKDFSR